MLIILKQKKYNRIKEKTIYTRFFSPLFETSSLSVENTDGKDFSDIPTEKRIRKRCKWQVWFYSWCGKQYVR